MQTMTHTPAPMSPADFVAIILQGQDLDTYVRVRLDRVGPAAEGEQPLDDDGIYDALVGEHGESLMLVAVSMRGLTMSSQRAARQEAMETILGHAAIIADEMGV